MSVDPAATGVTGSFAPAIVDLGNCFDFGPDAQLYPFSFSATTPGSDPVPLVATLTFTHSCGGAQTVTAIASCCPGAGVLAGGVCR